LSFCKEEKENAHKLEDECVASCKLEQAKEAGASIAGR